MAMHVEFSGDEYIFYIDDRYIKSDVSGGDDGFIIKMKNEDANKGIFGDNKFSDIPINIYAIIIEDIFSVLDINNSIEIGRWYIDVYIQIKMRDNFYDYLSEIQSYIYDRNKSGDINFNSNSTENGSTLSIKFDYLGEEDVIDDNIDHIFVLISSAINHANSKYKKKNSLNITFDFPQEVATACEQYLLYFTDFLRELGIDAGTNISHDAGKTLFSVVPTDADQALQQIRDALDIYLRIPVVYSPGTSIVPVGDIPTQQLMAQVNNLNTQLMLGAALIQTKEATIQAQQATIGAQAITIATQQRVLNGEILVRSIQDATPSPSVSDEEPVLGGTVILGRAGPDGAQVNFAEIYRKLRNWLSGN
jgi:hypothetical protein